MASSIAREAAEWLMAKGEPLWEEEQFAQEVFVPHIAARELYFAKVNDAAVGIMILQWEDPLFWPDKPAGEARFIHRLGVRRKVAKQGVSHALLEFAKEETRRCGRRYLRLDTAADRPKLRAVYESNGFTFHSLQQVGRFLVARYELKLF